MPNKTLKELDTRHWAWDPAGKYSTCKAKADFPTEVTPEPSLKTEKVRMSHPRRNSSKLKGTEVVRSTLYLESRQTEKL